MRHAPAQTVLTVRQCHILLILCALRRDRLFEEGLKRCGLTKVLENSTIDGVIRGRFQVRHAAMLKPPLRHIRASWCQWTLLSLSFTHQTQEINEVLRWAYLLVQKNCNDARGVYRHARITSQE